jgi:hypothetical protein
MAQLNKVVLGGEEDDLSDMPSEFNSFNRQPPGTHIMSANKNHESMPDLHTKHKIGLSGNDLTIDGDIDHGEFGGQRLSVKKKKKKYKKKKKGGYDINVSNVDSEKNLDDAATKLKLMMSQIESEITSNMNKRSFGPSEEEKIEDNK